MAVACESCIPSDLSVGACRSPLKMAQWRSSEMQLVQLIMQTEAAKPTIDRLGDLGIMEFKDVRTWPPDRSTRAFILRQLAGQRVCSSTRTRARSSGRTPHTSSDATTWSAFFATCTQRSSRPTSPPSRAPSIAHPSRTSPTFRAGSRSLRNRHAGSVHAQLSSGAAAAAGRPTGA